MRFLSRILMQCALGLLLSVLSYSSGVADMLQGVPLPPTQQKSSETSGPHGMVWIAGWTMFLTGTGGKVMTST
jgi:hypothetical protein